ncbi:MAG: glycosyltransferase family 4 protein [Planctomycetota bacterium]
MRIAINGLALSRNMTGVGRTTQASLQALLKRNDRDEFLLFLPSDAPEDLGPMIEAPNLECVRTDVSLVQPIRSLFFSEFALPRRLKGARIDLYYSPSYLLPVFPGADAEVICVHDLAWRILPRTKSFAFRSYMNRRLPSALKRAARIVCVSRSTADDLIRHYPRSDPDRIRVVPNGVDRDIFRPDGPGEEDPDAPPFVAVVGNQDPRKNIATLLDAFPGFRARMRACRMVLVGPPRDHPTPQPAVDFLGYLSDAELAALYRRALMVVQPSFYEGFGLPVLEAMACGTAVACADIPVFREVAADCARYFDPRDAKSISSVMEELAGDHDLRQRLEEGGLKRAAQLTWDATAEKLDAVFTEALA